MINVKGYLQQEWEDFMIGMGQHRKGFWGGWQNSISVLDWCSPYGNLLGPTSQY